MTQNDQLTFQNPVDRYAQISPPKQDQPEPGFDEEIVPKLITVKSRIAVPVGWKDAKP